MPFGFHPLYLLVLLVLVLIIFGPGKLPEVAGALGRGIREFNRAKDELTMQMQQAWNEPPAATTPVAEPDPAPQAAAVESEAPAGSETVVHPASAETETQS